jgi:hypothetical protein
MVIDAVLYRLRNFRIAWGKHFLHLMRKQHAY